MHRSKFKLAIVISFDNKEFWQMGYNGPGGPMGPGGRMMGPGKPMGPGGPTGPVDPRGMMGPGGTQDIVSSLEICSQCADEQLMTGPGRLEGMCGVCSQVLPDVQLAGGPGRVESICGVSIV